MKHLIKDIEFVAYLEETLSKEEVRQLKRKLKDNDELDLLYHLQLSYNEGMKEYEKELIGEDDFKIDLNYNNSVKLQFNSELSIAADIKFPEKE